MTFHEGDPIMERRSRKVWWICLSIFSILLDISVAYRVRRIGNSFYAAKSSPIEHGEYTDNYSLFSPIYAKSRSSNEPIIPSVSNEAMSKISSLTSSLFQQQVSDILKLSTSNKPSKTKQSKTKVSLKENSSTDILLPVNEEVAMKSPKTKKTRTKTVNVDAEESLPAVKDVKEISMEDKPVQKISNPKPQSAATEKAKENPTAEFDSTKVKITKEKTNSKKPSKPNTSQTILVPSSTESASPVKSMKWRKSVMKN